ncbi:hypothetical protein PanWU01x14_371990, partial [Parasponia andersonii]
ALASGTMASVSLMVVATSGTMAEASQMVWQPQETLILVRKESGKPSVSDFIL